MNTISNTQSAWRADMLKQFLQEVRKHEPKIQAATEKTNLSSSRQNTEKLPSKGGRVNCYA